MNKISMSKLDSVKATDLYISDSIKPINQICVGGTNYDISLSSDVFARAMKEYLAMNEIKPTFKHQCNNCGAVLALEIDKHIFSCPYCGTTYAVGTMQINDRG